jgi:hypothetical protein
MTEFYNTTSTSGNQFNLDTHTVSVGQQYDDLSKISQHMEKKLQKLYLLEFSTSKISKEPEKFKKSGHEHSILCIVINLNYSRKYEPQQVYFNNLLCFQGCMHRCSWLQVSFNIFRAAQ